MKSFLIKLTIAALTLVIVGGVVFTWFLPQYFIPIIPISLVVFLIVTILVHAFQLRMAKKDMAKFTRSNMLTILIKLIVYSVFAVIYIALKPENAIPFVVCLFVIYLVFNFVEVAELTRVSKKHS